jgi:leucyl aminopeptidase
MDLLDFNRLRTKLEAKNVSRTIEVLLYSKHENNFIFHSKTKASLDAFLVENLAQGKVGETFFTDNILLVCIGNVEKDSIVLRTNVKKAMRGLYNSLKNLNNSKIVFLPSKYSNDAIYALVIASYKYDFLKKEKCTLDILLDTSGYQNIVETAHAQNFSRFLGDTPANLMTPTLFCRYAEAFLMHENCEFKIYDKKEIADHKMNLILSVSQGSAEEPKMLHVRYFGNNLNGGKVDLAMVGKGVTFDSGGISLKPSAGMYSMKHDMMGAATLLATFKLIVSMKLKINVTGTFPLVENMPGSRATKPGDVFTSMKGLTVEIDNTDAEGRLILADAITFAQKDEPRYLIDAATLTGAMVVSLGTVYGGYFCNDDGFSDAIYKAGVDSNDLLWRMPVSPYYTESLKSHVADLNNMGGREGGSCKAAGFLSKFVNEKTIWAHFDIAGLMDKSFNSELFGKEATGRPVPAFIELVKNLAMQ